MPPDTIGYRDAEYNRSDGPRFHGAATAWVDGHTGAGSLIGIIDTGIFLDEAELSGRISSLSTDIFSSRDTVEGEDDHGTFVALVAAAGNNGFGTVGIAYSSSILAIRADDPGSCPDDCTFGNMAAAIDYAVANNATVINMSLGGSSATQSEIDAIRRASDAGIIVVIAAGNDGASRPDPFARTIAGEGFQNVIIAGSVDSSGTISDFSNKALGRPDYYLAALGENVTAYLDGGLWSISGTSFSAPQIAGAVALVAAAFPHLTAEEIVDLLFETAQDVGAAGVDNVYGNGILDIHRAFQPVGTTTLAHTGTSALPLGDTVAVGSPAMGDALTTQSLSTLVLDKYRRAFSYDLGPTMRSATLREPLRESVGGETRHFAAGNDAATLAFTFDGSPRRAPGGGAREMTLSLQDSEAARVLAARVSLKIAPGAQLGFAYAEGARGLVMQLQGKDRPAFLIAREAGGEDGTFRQTDMSVAMRKQLGAWGLTLAGESGSVYSGDRLWLAYENAGRRSQDSVRSFGVIADRAWNDVAATLGLNLMAEDRTVLGGRFHQALGGGGANTVFVDADVSWAFARNWRLVGAMRGGWTFADRSSVIDRGSILHSRAWSLDLERVGVFGPTGRIALRVAQPLRVESGGLNLRLPVAFDYETMSAVFGSVPLSLAPDGREIVSEIAWRGPLWGGGATAGVFYRHDPGHYATTADDAGVALRWSRKF